MKLNNMNNIVNNNHNNNHNNNNNKTADGKLASMHARNAEQQSVTALMSEIRARGFVKGAQTQTSARGVSGRVARGDVSLVPAVVRRSYEEVERHGAVRRAVQLHNEAQRKATRAASTSSNSNSNNIENNSVAQLFAVKPTATKVTQRVVVLASLSPMMARKATAITVGNVNVVVVDEKNESMPMPSKAPTTQRELAATATLAGKASARCAARRACVAAIARGAFALSASGERTRVTHRVVVGVGEAAKRACVRRIAARGSGDAARCVTLRACGEPRVRTTCVVGGECFVVVCERAACADTVCGTREQ
jgi:hypothetical protein